MKITIFQSDKGDCLLFTGSDGKYILVDGGMRDSYEKHVAPTIHQIHTDNKKLDLICVSHIDQDHISGILEVLDNMVDWRIHEYKIDRGDTDHREPNSFQPPEVLSIWHNAFHEQIGQNVGEIEDMLAAFSRGLSGSDIPEDLTNSELIYSKKEAIQLSRRLNARQLNIPLNDQFGGKLVYLKTEQPKVNIGSMSIQIIGPSDKSLKKLKQEWNKWLEDNERVIEEIREQARFDEERMSGDLAQFFHPILIQAKILGQRKEVTAPNLASIIFVVEEAGKRVIMTGDSHCKDILEGLKATGYMSGGSGLHVDVLKIQHHGSENNIDKDFCKKVTANHYIFCGNGAHENPDLDALEVLINSRIGSSQDRSPNPQCSRDFTLWFNSSSQETKDNYQEHMRKVEQLVQNLTQQSNGQMSYKFIGTGKHKFELNL